MSSNTTDDRGVRPDDASSNSKPDPSPTVVARGQEYDSSSDDELPPKTWKSYIWDTLDKSPQERKFLFKLDAIILTFASLGYFIKNLNQININNAFVSGMREDLGMLGNELNYLQTVWTVGYVIGEIPRYAG